MAALVTAANVTNDHFVIDVAQNRLRVKDGFTFNPAFNTTTNALTFDTAGGVPVVVDLSSLKDSLASVTEDTNSIDLTGTGAALTPLKADLKVAPGPDNALTVDANGAAVSKTALRGEVVTDLGGVTTIGYLLPAA